MTRRLSDNFSPPLSSESRPEGHPSNVFEKSPRCTQYEIKTPTMVIVKNTPLSAVRQYNTQLPYAGTRPIKSPKNPPKEKRKLCKRQQSHKTPKKLRKTSFFSPDEVV